MVSIVCRWESPTRDERLVDDGTMIRLSKTRAESRCKAKLHLRHIRDRMAQRGVVRLRRIRAPSRPSSLIEPRRLGGRRSHLRLIDDQGPQFWRHYREGAHELTHDAWARLSLITTCT
jgi:hypothetical protein